MTIAYGCVLIMIIFPYVFTTLAKVGPGFNNHTPREYLERLVGWRRRAHYVQLNSFETTPAFMAAVIIAHQLHATQPVIDKLAVTYIITRVFYAISYIKDKDLLRTFFWMLGFGCVIALFLVSAY